VSLIGVATVGLLAGCAGVPTESTENPETTARAESVADKPATGDSTAAATSSSSSSSASTAASEPRSSWREGRAERRSAAGEPTRSTASTSARDTGSSESALVAQLNEASRELATLRAANARLRAEKERPAPASSARVGESAAKADPVDDKIAASLKSYGALKQELAGFLADIERGRAENAAASAKLKDAVNRSDDARAAVGRLENELRAERRARTEAEQAASKLQEQLRTIARALAAAGLSVDKLAAGAESGGRR